MRIAILAGLALAACASTTPTARPPVTVPPAVTPTAGTTAPATAPSARMVGFERDCDGGDMWSCSVAGIFYWSGAEEDHVPRDWPKAVARLQPACEANVPEACAAYIQILEAGGHGVQRDATRAREIVERMCAEGWDHFCTREAAD